MRWKKSIQMIEAHAEGEVGRVVTSGIIDVPGESMLEKMNFINQVDDSLRRFLVFEPRGQAQMSTNLLFPPTVSGADVGMIVLQGDKAHSMSGSNCICTVTVLLETGMIRMTEPETIVVLETPAGLVRAKADCKDGKCLSVALDMTPSFAYATDVELLVEDFGLVSIDIAFGGIFYGLIDVAQFDLDIIPENARALVNIGTAIHRSINKEMEICHPEINGLDGLSYTMFTGFNPNGELKGATVLPPGRIDRSPCGTGNAARLAVMYERGQIGIGTSLSAHSIIDSTFSVEIAGTKKVGDFLAVTPRIRGRGWIHGIHQVGLDPTDPYPFGFKVADCWGDAFDLLK